MEHDWNRQRAETVLKTADLELDNGQVDKLLTFGELVFEGNKQLNLTGKIDWPIFIYKHIFDSLAILPYIKEEKERVLDLGTGAGFPGLPLAIARPGWQLTLLDSLKKRIGFLAETVETLAVPLELVWSRAEDYGRGTGRGQFSLVVSRAVAKLPVLLELSLPLLQPSGRFVAYKGPEDELETADFALKTLGGELEAVHQLELPEGYGQRQLIVIRKAGTTPDQYPRRAGIPEKKPLLP